MKKAIAFAILVGVLAVYGVLLAAAEGYIPNVTAADPRYGGYGTELVSQEWGAFNAAQVSGSYAYVCQGQRLSIFDIATPGQFTMVGQSDVMTGPSYALELSGNYAFLADPGVLDATVGSRVHILDISNPAAPYEALFFENFDAKAYDIELYNGYAFLANYPKGLWVLDVRDPLQPHHVTNLSISGGLTRNIRVAHHAGSGATYAYLTAGHFLVVVDVTDPNAPVVKTSLENNINREFADLEVSGDRAYLTDYSGNLHVVNISDPLHPSHIADTSSGSNFYYSVLANGSALFVQDMDMSLFSLGLSVMGISTGGLPEEIGYYSFPDDLKLYLQAMTALPGSAKIFILSNSHLRELDASLPSSPVVTRSFSQVGTIDRLIRSGNLLFVNRDSLSLEVFDISDLYAPVKLGSLPQLFSTLDFLSGGYAYLLKPWDISVSPPGPGSLILVDAHDPAHMAVTDIFTSTGRPKDVAVLGGYAYLAEGSAGLGILDISDPYNLEEAGRISLWNSVDAVAVGSPANDPGKIYAYIQTGSTGLRVVDVTDLDSITETGGLAGYGGSHIILYTPPAGNGPAPSAGYYVALAGGIEGSGGVDIFDVSNPAEPVYKDGYSLGDNVENLVAQGGVIYAAASLKGVQMLTYDGDDWDSLGYYRLPEEVVDVAVAGDLLHLAAGSNGMFNVWFGPPSHLTLEASGVITSTYHNTTLVFPSGTFTTSVELDYLPRFPAHMPDQFGLQGAGVYFELTSNSAYGSLLPVAPYQFEWRYDEAQFSGRAEQNPGLYYWSGTVWIREPSSSVDSVNGVLSAESMQTGLLAVLVEAERLYLPVLSR